MNNNPVFINTCLFKKSFSRVRDYSKAYGNRIGFEILSMFDLPEFEQARKQQRAAQAQEQQNQEDDLWFLKDEGWNE